MSDYCPVAPEEGKAYCLAYINKVQSAANFYATVKLTPDGKFSTEVQNSKIFATVEAAKQADRWLNITMIVSIFGASLTSFALTALSTLFITQGLILFLIFIVSFLGGAIVTFGLCDNFIARFLSPSHSVTVPMVLAWHDMREQLAWFNSENTPPALLAKVHHLEAEARVIYESYEKLVGYDARERGEWDFLTVAGLLQLTKEEAQRQMKIINSTRSQAYLALPFEA